jgi:hypothetical protein
LGAAILTQIVNGDTERWGLVAVLVLGLALAGVIAGSFAPTTGGGLSGAVGEVDGVTYNQSISVTVEDGLNESEREVLVARSMARVEVIRGLTFEERVGVEVISREEYRNRRNPDRSETERTWENLRWEALFIIGEDRDAATVLNETFGSSVLGYYSPSDEQIVVVSDAEEPTLDTGTLVHELVHALQHQQFGLAHDADTTDAKQARDSVIEGEAELVSERYLDRCGTNWSCVRPPTENTSIDLSLGVQLQLLAPYTQGQTFVETVQERGGWEAVDDLHRQLPTSSTRFIHPDRYPGADPVEVTVTDRSGEGWHRLDATDTLGEASVYTMLVHSEVVDVEELTGYDHPFSAGWTGGQIALYERDGEFGYVWETAWETPTDAEQFALAYRDVLEANGGVATGEDLSVVPDGGFEDAFRVTRENTTVRIVNAPTVEGLTGVHGGTGARAQAVLPARTNYRYDAVRYRVAERDTGG